MTSSAKPPTDKPKKLTPMMQQYRAIKETLPERTILFFRLGDFYEMFFEDAVIASEILNITLTGRAGGESGRISMCGFPHHAFSSYVKNLLDENYKVAVCEQIGDPKASKGLVERKVTRIITPATYLDDETPEQSFQYIAALFFKGEQCYLSYLELSTGEFYARETDKERVYDELNLLFPREVVISKSAEEDESLTQFLKETLKASVTVYEDWIFEYAEGERYLKKSFNVESIQGFSIAESEPIVSVCGAVLYFLNDHFHEALDHVQRPKLFNPEDLMVLDRSAQKSLEFLISSEGSRKVGTLFSVINRTATAMGSRNLEHWMMHPLLDLKQIHARQEAVAEIVEREAWRSEVSNMLQGVKDIERTLSRLNYGVANARDLINLKAFLDRVPSLRNLLGESSADMTLELQKQIQPFPRLQEMIQSAVLDEPPLTIKEGGIIRKGYSEELDELTDIAQNGKRWLLEFQKREIERTGIKSLKIKFSGVFGYTIEVSKAYLKQIPEDYTRRQTLANAERFIVPELKEWDEKISGAQDKIKSLEYQIFCQLREEVLKDLSELQSMARAIGVLDTLVSFAQIANEKSWVLPEVHAGYEIEIEGGRHPVVESMLPSGKFIENDTHLNRDDNQLMVLTGPNMAGKSTYIRQVGHLVLLAQIGSYVPADSCKVGLVDRIFTRIGASDNLSKGESTFMVEMLETANILNEATDRSLLILDEVGRGTSTFDGVSIAWAICEFLAGGKFKPRTLFATHYHELIQLEEKYPGVQNYMMKVRDTPSGIVFLRKVGRGATDRSYGVHVAELAGLPEEVIKRSKEILRDLESQGSSHQIKKAQDGKSKTSRKRTLDEPTLFDEVIYKEHPVLDKVKNLEIDNMSPIEALNWIHELKKEVSGE